jgi:hypothetical protein
MLNVNRRRGQRGKVRAGSDNRTLPLECPNGASASSPRLARTRLPWVNVIKWKQPQRGCGKYDIEQNSHNRVAVENIDGMFTQGSPLMRPTLGFGTESRWDSSTFPPQSKSRYDS